MRREKLRLFSTPILFVLASVMVSVCYTNCSGFAAVPFDANGSNASLSEANTNCDDQLMSVYKASVQPFFQSATTCAGCHIEGGVGLGTFASSETDKSFAAFNAAGFSKVQYMATNPAHKPPFTGLQNQPAMDKIGATWTAAQTEHLTCVSKSENGGVDESLLTAAKTAPSIYTGANGKQTLTWDLDSSSDLDESVKRSLAAKISIDVQVLYQKDANGVSTAKGYVFSNPQMGMKLVGKQAVVEGLFFQINGRPITSQTTFTNVSRVISGTQMIPLMNASANTLIQPIGTNDTFQLYLKRIVPTDASDDSTTPLTPILALGDMQTLSDAYTSNVSINTFILRDSGILRWCLTDSPTAPKSTEETCKTLMTGDSIVNGWSMKRPTSFKLPAGDGVKTVYLWVANDGLKINQSPAQATITLDTLAPSAPSIQSIQTSDTQVANMTVTHANEADVAGWCVFEQNAVLAKPTVTNSDRCWKWTDKGVKPTTVGFKGGGTRNVWVFARDKAGNISPASNVVQTSNPLGAITYSALTGPSASKTAILTNRCTACHSSSSNPGFSKLQLFNYESALVVVDNGQLISRINDPISPMPNVNEGLMPIRERDLIRLWTFPEEGPRPLQ